jgi:hypothetical protein
MTHLSLEDVFVLSICEWAGKVFEEVCAKGEDSLNLGLD